MEYKQGSEILRKFQIQLELADDAEDHVEEIAAKQKAARAALGDGQAVM